jgi:threonine aldolase
MNTSIVDLAGKSSNYPPEQFFSDNGSGICPVALEALIEANDGYAAAYGNDRWTEIAANMFRDLFEKDVEVFFTFNGTAANSLSLASLCNSYHGIICHELAHIETDECGAPEYASNGSKLQTASGPNGKLTPESIRHIALRRTDIHYPKSKAISLTQCTEVGTVYKLNELEAICEVARELDLKIHLDGARFANAIVTLGCTPAEATWKVGVDVLCFSGTKNGLAFGEAVIFFDRKLAQDFDYRCKQAGQLCSKMRYIAAPWIALLKDDNWLKMAAHANQCAAYLAEKLREIPKVDFVFEREANGIFINLPDHVANQLKEKGWIFYNFLGNAIRFMCSWSTTLKGIDLLIADIKAAI